MSEPVVAGLSITPVRDADIPQITALAAVIWRVHYANIISGGQIEYMLAQRYSDAVIRAELARGDIWWRQAVAHGQPVGYTSCLLAGEPRIMKLDKLYVHPDWQRRGVGARLLREVMQIARDAGSDVVTLTVNKRNHVALAAYRKYGFSSTGAVVQAIGSGYFMDDYVMSRPTT